MSLAWCMIALTVVGGARIKNSAHRRLGCRPGRERSKTSEPQEPWPMDLAMATQIAFDNSEHFRVVEFGVCGLDAFFPLHPDVLRHRPAQRRYALGQAQGRCDGTCPIGRARRTGN